MQLPKIRASTDHLAGLRPQYFLDRKF